MIQITELFSIVHTGWCESSDFGQPRWSFHGISADGTHRQFITSPDFSSMFGYLAGSLEVGEILRVTYQKSHLGNLIAIKSEGKYQAQVDLNLEFKARVEQAALSETSHKPKPAVQKQRL